MRAIHRKLLRDLWASRGQALAIGLVIGAGVAMFVAYHSTFRSLDNTRTAYYERYRFADVWAGVKRAPNWLAARLAAIPGVNQVETRVAVGVNLDLPGQKEPISGLLMSIPPQDIDTLNDLAILRGRYIEAERPDEVLVADGFAKAHGLLPGASLAAVINGTRRQLRVVGIALSPEFVYTIRPGDMMPDDKRFGILWMNEKALATAYDLEGSFNDIAMKLQPGADLEEVLDRVDGLIETYGGRGAISRRLQTSHWYLENELVSLRSAGFMVPSIFLAVAIFLLNVTLSRLVTVQREQIAALKALGYRNFEIGLHYTLWSLSVSMLGCAIGVVFGRWMGKAMIGLYHSFFRFPYLEYRLSQDVAINAVAISLVAAVVGAALAVRKAVVLPPAEAMRPEPPAKYRRTLVEALGLGRWLNQPTRIVLRNLERRPGRFLASVVGVAFAGAMMVVGVFFIDAVDELIWVQFNVTQSQDMTVSFLEPRSAAALFETLRWPGVIHAEPIRSVPVRLRVGHRSRETSITGLDPGARLQQVIDISLEKISLPPEGLVLSAKLAEILGAQPGDAVQVEVLEGSRPRRTLPLTAVVNEYMGTSAYMDKEALHRVMREGGNVSGVHLAVDSLMAESLYQRIKEVPAAAGVVLRTAMIATFRKTTGENIGIMILFNVLFAGIICFGVSYNVARIAFSERSRELASLRVIGFTRREIAYILLGEQALINVAALPLAMILGYGFAALVVQAFDNELYRFPLIISGRTYAAACLVIVSAAVFSGLVVRRMLDRLDLVAVLKTRE